MTGDDTRSGPPTDPKPRGEPPSVWPYVLPMAGFLALTTLEGYLPTGPGGTPSPFWYPLGYAFKILAVVVLIVAFRPILADLRPLPSVAGAALAVALGLVVAAAWIGLHGHYPTLSFLGKRTEFDPTTLRPPARAAFLAVRMFGLVAVVPLIEELFYRSFLMRWVVDPYYDRMPIGRVTPAGLAVTTGVFGLSHPEWLPALLTGLAWGWLVGRTKSVSACVLSHAVANLALGVYVLAFHVWNFW